MPEAGFEFSGFLSPAVARDFYPTEQAEKDKTAVKLWLNLDMLTIERMEQLETDYAQFLDDATGVFTAVSELFKADDADSDTDTDAVAITDAVTDGKQPTAKKKKELAVAGKKPSKTGLPATRIGVFAMEKTRLRFYATVLGGRAGENDPTKRLIADWNLVRDGKPIPISYEVFLQMPPHGLAKLYQFVLGAANSPTPQEKKQSSST